MPISTVNQKGLDAPLTLTSPVLNSPVISTITNGAATLTLPTTSGTVVTSANTGMVRITSGSVSAASAVTVDGCFTSTYKNYVIYCNLAHSTGSSNSSVYLQFRASGVTNASSSYTYQTNYINANLNAGTAASGTSATSFVVFHNIDNNAPLVGQINVMNPFDAVRTQSNWTLYGEDDGYSKQMLGFGTQTQNTSFSGFTITLSQGTLTGTYDIYGIARG